MIKLIKPICLEMLGIILRYMKTSSNVLSDKNMATWNQTTVKYNDITSTPTCSQKSNSYQFWYRNQFPGPTSNFNYPIDFLVFRKKISAHFHVENLSPSNFTNLYDTWRCALSIKGGGVRLYSYVSNNEIKPLLWWCIRCSYQISKPTMDRTRFGFANHICTNHLWRGLIWGNHHSTLTHLYK